MSIPELVDIAKELEITKLRTTCIASEGGPLIKLTKDRNLLDLGVVSNNGDTIEIYMCNDSTFEEDVGPTNLL